MRSAEDPHDGDRAFPLPDADRDLPLATFAQSADGLAFVGEDSVVRMANPTLAKQIGLPVQWMVGRPAADVLPAWADRIGPAFRDACASGRPRRVEVPPWAHDARPLPARGPWDFVISPVLGAEGALRGCLLSLREASAGEGAAEMPPLDVILQQATDAIMVCDAGGNLQFVNAAAARLLLASDETRLELAGLAQEDVRYPDGRPVSDEQLPLALALRGQTLISREAHLVGADGAERDILISAAPARDAEGTIVGAVATFVDITERKRMEVELRESEELLRALTDSIPQLAWMARPDGFIFWYNRRWYEYTGTTLQQMEGNGWQAVHDPAMLPLVVERWRASLSTGEPFEMDFPLRGADGRYRWFLTRVLPLKDAKGRVVRWFGTNTDVSDRREAEAEHERLLESLQSANGELLVASLDAQTRKEEAERSAAQMRALLANLGEGVTVVDAMGRIVLRNEAAQEILGTADAERQKGLDERQINFLRLDGEPAPFADTPISRALRGEQFTGDEGVIVRPDGLRRRILVSGAGVRDETGRVVMGIVVFRDVTELRQLERMKDDYVSLISHDLRNPLTVVMGQVDWLRRLLAKKGLAAESSLAETALKSARRMNAMIQDLVESARLESGRLEMREEPTDLLQLVSDIVERVGTVEDRVRLRVEALGWVPPVPADPDRLERAIVNLITNALKYSPADRPVTVRVDRGDGEAIIAVSDEGEGIPPEEIPLLGQRFHQVKATQPVGGGLGLGLYITRLIAEAHGGRLRIESELGKGSTFSVVLPIDAS